MQALNIIPNAVCGQDMNNCSRWLITQSAITVTMLTLFWVIWTAFNDGFCNEQELELSNETVYTALDKILPTS